jgi:hypothetical protein
MIRAEHGVMIRRLALLAAALLASAEVPPPPATLTPYITGGTFRPGDYGWLRGAFDDATPAQKAEWHVLDAWLKQCRQESTAQTRAELIALGIADPKIRPAAYGDAPCGAVDRAFPQGDMGDDWSLFQTKLASARRIADTLVWSAALAQAVGDEAGDILTAQLIARPITDQVLRTSLAWNQGPTQGAPPLDPMEAGLVRGLTWSAIAARDHANTVWMKTVVAKHGWPTIAMVGAQASSSAWMLVQHADDDPVFQLKMLRLMEPLAARGQVSPHNYALLYDRVMLQMVGTQRYGTQMSCETGSWQPFPLEDAAKVEGYRHAAGLNTMAQNAARILHENGPCPPMPTAH